MSSKKECDTCKWSLPENKDPERPEICKSPNDDLYILEGYQCWEPKEASGLSWWKVIILLIIATIIMTLIPVMPIGA